MTGSDVNIDKAERSDSTLVALAKVGNAPAIDQLIRKYWPDAYRTAARILRCHADVGIARRFGDRVQRRERRRDHDLDVGEIPDEAAEFLDEADRLEDGLVHLPVGGDEWSAHWVNPVTCHVRRATCDVQKRATCVTVPRATCHVQCARTCDVRERAFCYVAKT